MSSIDLVPIKKDNDDIVDIILENVVKMLVNRKLISREKEKETIDKVIALKPDDFSYQIKLDKGVMLVKLMLQNITTVSKSTGISEFLLLNKDKHNILVVKSITKTPFNIITTRYPNTELFLEKDLMIDKVSNYLLPKFEVMTPTEKDNVLTTYNLTQRECLRISHKDPMVKYYGGVPGDLIRIIRPSETAGFYVAYRLVVKKEM